MNGNDFKKELKNPKNIYCLVSTDCVIVDMYVNRFKEAIEADYISYGQIKPYGKLFKKKTLNVLYLPKLPDNIFERPEFIFIYTDSIDKRSSIYKKHKNQFIEINTNDINKYTNYILKHTKLSKEDAEQLVKNNNNDFGLIISAITICNETNTICNDIDYSNNIYDWVDAFIKKETLPRCVESPISVMALLSTNCTNLLNVKRNNTLNMNPYIVKCMNNLKDFISEQELITIINDCFYLDIQVKKGIIDINDCIPYLILRRYNNATTN